MLRYHCGIRVHSMTMSDTCATHVSDKGKSESCLVKAPAMQASESVLVVGELLCTSVQANTERDTWTETRDMCSCWGYKQQHGGKRSPTMRGRRMVRARRGGAKETREVARPRTRRLITGSRERKRGTAAGASSTGWARPRSFRIGSSGRRASHQRRSRKHWPTLLSEISLTYVGFALLQNFIHSAAHFATRANDTLLT